MKPYLLIVFFLVFLIIPAMAQDIQCVDSSAIDHSFTYANAVGGTDRQITGLYFRDIGERTGFRYLETQAREAQFVMDVGAPYSDWTTVSFWDAGLTTNYGTGIIGYNSICTGFCGIPLLETIDYKFYIQADDCGMFSGLDGGTSIRLVYTWSAINNFTFTNSDVTAESASAGSDTIYWRNYAANARVGPTIGNAEDPEISNDCYDLNVTLDITEGYPNSEWNRVDVYRNGFNSFVNVTNSGGTSYYSVTDTGDDAFLIPSTVTPFSYYIGLLDTGVWCNSTYTPEPVTATTYTLRVWVKDGVTGNTLSGVNYVVHDDDFDGTGVSEYQNRTNWYSPTNIDAVPGHTMNVSVSKTGYTDGDGNPGAYILVTTMGTVDPFDVTLYLYPTCNAPAGQACLYFRTMWLSTVDGDTIPLSGVSITVNNQTALTNSAGTLLRYVPVNTTYPYTATKTNYIPVAGSVVVGTGITVELVYMYPTAVTTPTPVVTTVTPTTTPGPGGILIDRLSGVLGPLFLAALIIFIFMFGAGYAVSQFGMGGSAAGFAVIGGGIIGFIADIFLGLISIAWLFAMFALCAMILAGKWYLGGGSG